MQGKHRFKEGSLRVHYQIQHIQNLPKTLLRRRLSRRLIFYELIITSLLHRWQLKDDHLVSVDFILYFEDKAQTKPSEICNCYVSWAQMCVREQWRHLVPNWKNIAMSSSSVFALYHFQAFDWLSMYLHAFQSLPIELFKICADLENVTFLAHAECRWRSGKFWIFQLLQRLPLDY